MESEYIKFIGTGSAAASKVRFHSSFVLFSSDRYCLMDAGDGVSKALLSADIHFNQIDSVIISHMHPDHFAGLPGLLIQMKLNKRENGFTIYIHESLTQTIQSILDLSYLFSDRFDFPIKIVGYSNYEFFHPLENLEVLARQNSHLNDYIKNSPGNISFACSSFLFKFNNKSIFYTGDIGSEEDLYIFNDYAFDILISEVTHIDLLLILNAFKASGASKLYLTHLNEGDTERIYHSLTADLSHKVIPAKEGMILPI